jgi:hypothetical protein
LPPIVRIQRLPPTRLEILPASFARAEVLAHERQFKQKIGSRTTKLNAN